MYTHTRTYILVHTNSGAHGHPYTRTYTHTHVHSTTNLNDKALAPAQSFSLSSLIQEELYRGHCWAIYETLTVMVIVREYNIYKHTLDSIPIQSSLKTEFTCL